MSLAQLFYFKETFRQRVRQWRQACLTHCQHASHLTPHASRFQLEQLEPRVLLDAVPALPLDIEAGAIAGNIQQLVNTQSETQTGEPASLHLSGLDWVGGDVSALNGQIVYLDVDGASAVTYNGPVLVEGIDVPSFEAPGGFAGREGEIIASVLTSLNQTFADLNVTFTVSGPDAGIEYSTIYVGGDDSAFALFGRFLSLAEQVDVGNEDHRDIALIFSDQLAGRATSFESYTSALTGVIEHEAGHLLGYKHADGAQDGLLGVGIVTLQGVPLWLEQGPGPITNNSNVLFPVGQNNPTTGAIQAVAAHPTNAAVVYVGTVGGGVWGTRNAPTGNAVPTTSPTWTPLTDQFPSLAISALAFDVNNANVIYAGTGSFSSRLIAPDPRAAVGLLRGTINPVDGSIIWRVVGRPTLDGHRITGIVANGNTIVVSADEDGLPGSGDGKFLFRSTNGGSSFTAITKDTANRVLGTVTDLVVVSTLPNIMYISVTGAGKGVYRSADSGASWTQINANAAADPNGLGLEVLDGVDGDGIAGNDNLGDDISRAVRIRLAIHDNAGVQAIYAALVGPTQATGPGSGAYVFRSAGVGATPSWQSVGEPLSNDRFWTDANIPPDNIAQPAEVVPQSNPLNPSSQVGGAGASHISFVADRTLPNVVYIGGDTGPSVSAGNRVVATHDSVGLGASAVGRIFRGDASTNQWVQIVGSDDANTAGLIEGARGTAPHADSRNMVFDANNTLLEVDDGGIARLITPNTAPNAAGTTGRQWQSLTPGTAAGTAAFNNNLRITEFYSIGVNTGLAGGARLLGGAQDNGTAFQQIAFGDDWVTLTGGDGAIVQVDNFAAPVHYWSRERFQGFTQWTDADRDGTPVGDPAELVTLNVIDARTAAAATPTTMAVADGGLPFVTPLVINSRASTRMLIGGSGLWEITNVNLNAPAGAPLTRTVLASPIVLPGAGTFTAMAYGGVNPVTAAVNPLGPNPDVFWAARGNRLHVRTGAGAPVVAHAIPAAGSVLAIAFDPVDATTAYIVLDRGGTNLDRVYRVTTNVNGTLNWQIITGNLLDTHLDTIEVIPVLTLIPAGVDRVVLVGGRTGVSRAINPTTNSTIWTEYGSGLANSIVADLANSTAGLYAGTLGRSAWNIPAGAIAASINQEGVLRLTGTGGTDFWTLMRDPQQPWLLTVTENLLFSQSYQLSTIRRIEVSGLGGDDLLIINVDNGPINVSEKIHFDGGENADGSVDNDVLNIVGTKKPVENNFDAATRTSKLKARDPFGGRSTQVVTWTADVENPLNNVGPPPKVTASAAGLQDAAAATTGLFAQAFPGLGNSLEDWANGIRILDGEGFVDPVSKETAARAAAGQVQRAPKPSPSQGDPFLLRLFQSGFGAFSLEAVSEDGEISSLEALRASLDGLDATSGNVTFTEVGDVTTFNVQILKSLQGSADLDVAAQVLGGLLDLEGDLEIAADVALNLRFGVDGSGFFILPNAPGSPEISVSNIRVTGEVQGQGQLGFLGVTVSGATLTLDPSVKIAIKLKDPGTGAADGLIRLAELTGEVDTFSTTTFQGNPTGPDVVLTADVEVAAQLSTGEPLFELGDAQITLTWADVTLPEQVTLNVSAGASADVLGFLQRSADNVLDGLSSVAGQLQEAAGIGIFATKIPILDRTLGEIMDDVAEPIVIADASVGFISAVVPGLLNQSFLVNVSGLDLVKRGVGVGDTVFYRSGGQEVQGTVGSVDTLGFTVAYALGLDHAPDAVNQSFRIVGPGTIQSQITSLIDGLKQRLSFQGSTPTLQELLEEAARLIGVDFADLDVRVTGTGLDRTVEFAIPFNPDPIQFTEHIDFGGSIPGLTFDTSADVKVGIDPLFRLPIGIRLHPDVPIAQRFFIIEDALPEITLGLSVLVDNPNIAGKIQDVFQVKLQENSTVIPNQGIALTGTITINLVDPTASGDGADERITLNEFSPAELTDMFQAGIAEALDIDGLMLTAVVAGTPLGSL